MEWKARVVDELANGGTLWDVEGEFKIVVNLFKVKQNPNLRFMTAERFYVDGAGLQTALEYEGLDLVLDPFKKNDRNVYSIAVRDRKLPDLVDLLVTRLQNSNSFQRALQNAQRCHMEAVDAEEKRKQAVELDKAMFAEFKILSRSPDVLREAGFDRCCWFVKPTDANLPPAEIIAAVRRRSGTHEVQLSEFDPAIGGYKATSTKLTRV